MKHLGDITKISGYTAPVVPYCISEIIISCKGVAYNTENGYGFCENKIGTEMFLTRGDAENALKGVAK